MHIFKNILLFVMVSVLSLGGLLLGLVMHNPLVGASIFLTGAFAVILLRSE